MAESVFTYRVLGGNHRDADGNEYAKGDTFESKDPDLKNKFPNKFKKIDVTDVDIDDEEDIDEVPKKTGPQDVTADFPAAVDAGLTVTRDKRGWYVADDGEPTHEKALKKGAVAAHIEAWLEE